MGGSGLMENLVNSIKPVNVAFDSLTVIMQISKIPEL
jgi:hypothetical protein